jgi:thiol-disulfide isomerase/thioredoxin
MHRLTQRLAVLSAAFVPCVFALAADPNDGRLKPSAVALVEGIIDEESKVASLRSLYLRFEGKWTRPPAAIARSIVELKKQQPDREIKVEENSNLWPEMTEDLELAFDNKRVRKLAHWHKSSWNLCVFDGELAVAHAKYFTHTQEHYALADSPDRFFEYMFVDLSWLRIGAHPFWFEKQKFTNELRMELNGRPNDYALVGQKDYRGRTCYLLENRTAHRRLHVGVDDKRLHGLTTFFNPTGANTLPATEKAASRKFASSAELGAWIKSLSPDEHRQFYQRMNVEMFPLMKPHAEHSLDDYRELAPGFWFPATQGYTLFDTSATDTIDMQRELRLVEAKVNEPLAGSLFTLARADAVQVYDWRYDPPLSYKQQANRTPEEFEKIVEEHRQQNEQWKQQNAKRDALVGQPAPELPGSVWLNAEPMTLASLKGKVVVLDFWATTCGPCRNDLPVAESFHKDAKDSGIVVIGVHAAGTEKAEIEEFAKKLGLTYPIVVDAEPPPEQIGFGLLAVQLGVNGIPYSFAIDPQGRIAAHGSLREMLSKARELANKPTKE